MHDLSRRAVLLNVAAASAWPGGASAEEASSRSPDARRRLVLEVSALAERFHRAAVERTRFADATVGRYARDLAADHGVRVERLNASTPARASAGGGDWDSGLSGVAAAAGWAAFDPFAGDESFLLAAHIVHSAAVDALRLGAGGGCGLDAVAAEAAYHAGLIRTALVATAAGRAAAPRAQIVTTWLASLRDAPAVRGGGPERRALRTRLLPREPRARGGVFPDGLRGHLRVRA